MIEAAATSEAIPQGNLDLARVDTCTADHAVIWRAQAGPGLREIRMIRQIEELAAKVYLVPAFIPGESLIDRGVKADDARAN